jgi:phage tail-like protein
VADVADRMFAHLPRVFRNRDETGDLARLLGVLQGVLFTGSTMGGRQLPGLEQYIEEIPTLFAPLGAQQDGDKVSRTPDRFLHWLAAWLSFTPHPLFPAESLRRIAAGIVPLYGLRGTKEYLVRLLELCFGQEVAHIHVDDRPRAGFTVGESQLGVDTRLAVSRPFCFKVAIERRDIGSDPTSLHESEVLIRRVRSVIEFAKPAHTAYELEILPHGRHQRDDEVTATASGR